MGKKEHHNRSDLIGEHSFGDAGQLISLLIFAIVYIVDGFFLKISTFLNGSIALYIRVPLAVIVFGISAYFIVRSIGIIFGEVREKPEVIRKGVYELIRHPMYVSEILLYFGLLCLNISLITVGVYLLIIIFLYAICRYEEKILIEHFGEEYKKYMQDVPMWIPRLWKKKNA